MRLAIQQVSFTFINKQKHTDRFAFAGRSCFFVAFYQKIKNSFGIKKYCIKRHFMILLLCIYVYISIGGEYMKSVLKGFSKKAVALVLALAVIICTLSVSLSVLHWREKKSESMD